MLILQNVKVLDPCSIQSHSPLTICFIAVGGNQSAWRKPMLNSWSRAIPHSSYGILVEPTYIYRYDILMELFSPWQALGVKSLAHRHKVAVTRFEPTLAQANRLMGKHSTN